MTRRSIVLVAAIAVLLAALPLLHQHPLTSSGSDSAVGSNGSLCVFCAVGTHRLPDPAPSLAAPDHIEYALTSPVATVLVAGVGTAVPSRAPPAA